MNLLIVFTWAQLFLINQRLKHIKLSQGAKTLRRESKEPISPFSIFFSEERDTPCRIGKALLGDVLLQPDSPQSAAYSIKDSRICKHVDIVHNGFFFDFCAANIQTIVQLSTITQQKM